MLEAFKSLSHDQVGALVVVVCVLSTIAAVFFGIWSYWDYHRQLLRRGIVTRENIYGKTDFVRIVDDKVLDEGI